MNRNQRIGLVVAAVVVAVVAFVVLRPSDDEEPTNTTTEAAQTQTQTSTTPERTTTETPTATTGQPTQQPYERIRLRDGEPVGGVKKISVERGELVRLEFSSNVADEMHIHGFDRYVDVPAGGTARTRFRADIGEGVFEIESHDFGTQVAELEIRP